MSITLSNNRLNQASLTHNQQRNIGKTYFSKTTSFLTNKNKRIPLPPHQKKKKKRFCKHPYATHNSGAAFLNKITMPLSLNTNNQELTGRRNFFLKNVSLTNSCLTPSTELHNY